MAKTATRLKTKAQIYVPQTKDDAAGDGKAKTANLITGEVQWRQRPPSVRVSKSDVVLEMLEKMGLSRFIRNGKPEVNKDAILDEPDAVRGIAGLTVVTGVEDFVITPFEQDAAA